MTRQLESIMATNELTIKACRAFVKHFGTPPTVYYPGCGNDWSPSEALKNSTIVYLDPVQAGLDEIKAHIPHAITICAKAEDVAPGARYDLVLNMHSHAPFEVQVRDLRRGSDLLIANKMSDAAFDHDGMELVAAMNLRSDALVMDAVDLEKYLEEDPEAPKIRWTNRRKIKAPYYVFRKK